ncbi:hypothetical protein [Nonomuraea gerenzanensis]|uniref:Uncharacterized protein n=1 Tax=Nonomuraea gerenzanensis TaxID=93944 RepID=A0A1M4EB23_9ACTN|nr:hypothetical protein [Nonomuraea gerenzanensis]UBU18123.1 hypothetical protein LCN96_24795 [Nonomuraea gerenzanensis]SBO95932.1 hypothetical protein BN4615_P5448 [Nonomuraea gerenzanensis]
MGRELDGAEDVRVAGAQPPRGLESVTRHEELVRLLAEQFARADVSLRELQARADRAGGTRLPRATCADMLAGRRFPKKAVMVAFLRGCRVPEHRLPAWEQAWERVRIARLTDMAARAQAEAQAQLNALATASLPQPPARTETTPEEVSAHPGATREESPAHAGTAREESPAHAGTAREESSAHAETTPERPPRHAGTAREKPSAHTATTPENPSAHAGTTREKPAAPPEAPQKEPSASEIRDRRRPFLLAVLASLAAATLGLLVGSWIPRQTTPEPRTVVDDGRAFGPGGSSRFTVTIDPANTGVRLTRRLDAGIGAQRADITVNGAPAGTWQPLPVQHAYRWSDQSVELPPALSAGRRALTVVNTFVSSDQDFNEFLYTVEQQVGGGWKLADTLDVGPRHLDSEAAHDYGITGPQTFAGVQEFAYPPAGGSG